MDKKYEPEIYEKINKILFPKDYLAFRMTGEMAAEVSDGSLSFLMDVPYRRWSTEMFELLGIPKSFVPNRLLESTDIVGELKASVAGEWGLKAGIPVIIGGGDPRLRMESAQGLSGKTLWAHRSERPPWFSGAAGNLLSIIISGPYRVFAMEFRIYGVIWGFR